MIEVTPEFSNAERAIAVTESGRVRVVRPLQSLKMQSVIVVSCDGVSNFTDINLEHLEKTESPRVETEEGIAKKIRLPQLENAPDPLDNAPDPLENAPDLILWTVAGDSKAISLNPVQEKKQYLHSKTVVSCVSPDLNFHQSVSVFAIRHLAIVRYSNQSCSLHQSNSSTASM
jgi:hypothetical protein